ncbi:sensor histidine kinase [Paenibacillus eucommiae]|uniref:histidine kinase n=1 Tax=Paenibacillus eucommiae TaxID=1355755 RepID=A0ABS4IWC1_9BACL|nr:sensor histidine kinase [Paenibacillus eucommiae]MBP1991893.1 two-component system sensor histidine kinase YesM [Paenibacillus eucommiae]
MRNFTTLNGKGWTYTNWPFALKLSIIFCLLVTVVVSLLGIHSYVLYRKSMQEQIEEFVPRMLSQVNNNLDAYVEEMLSVYRTILTPPYNQFLQGFFDNLEQGGNDRDILHTFKLNQSMVGIVLYTKSGSAFVRSAEGASWIDAAYENEPWFKELEAQENDPSILGIVKQHFIGSESENFTIAQPVYDPEGKMAGVMMLLCSLDTVRKVVQQADFGKGALLDIVDRQNKVVYSSTSGKSGMVWQPLEGLFPDGMNADSGSQLVSFGKQEYLISYNRSANSGWKVVSTIPLANLSERTTSVLSRSVIWTIAGIALAAIVASFVTYGMTNRLRTLSMQLRKLDLSTAPSKDSNEQRDEIGHLSIAFRDMTSRIHTLDQEVLESKLLRQEAEIRALQSQMNPHFLYNVLETIRMTLVREQPDKAENALVALGRIVRYQASHLADLVPASQELTFISHLISIEKLRFGNRLQVDFDVQPECLDCVMPSFLIQPLVENAIKHGISDYDFSIQILVRMRIEEQGMVIHVIDEGKGMSSERLEQVFDAMRVGAASENRIGLTNVYQRIKLIYGELGELHVDSAEGSGTIVTLRFPIPKPTQGVEPIG